MDSFSLTPVPFSEATGQAEPGESLRIYYFILENQVLWAWSEILALTYWVVNRSA